MQTCQERLPSGSNCLGRGVPANMGFKVVADISCGFPRRGDPRYAVLGIVKHVDACVGQVMVGEDGPSGHGLLVE